MGGCGSNQGTQPPGGPAGSFPASASGSAAAWERPEWEGGYVGDLKRVIEDGFEEIQPVLAAEGRESGDHFIDDTAETPPVDSLIMSLLLDDLGRQVFGSAADGHGLFVFEIEGAGESKVSHLDVPHLIQQDILRLETA